MEACKTRVSLNSDIIYQCLRTHQFISEICESGAETIRTFHLSIVSCTPHTSNSYCRLKNDFLKPLVVLHKFVLLYDVLPAGGERKPPKTQDAKETKKVQGIPKTAKAYESPPQRYITSCWGWEWGLEELLASVAGSFRVKVSKTHLSSVLG